jgi:multidrug resistance efflux pump
MKMNFSNVFKITVFTCIILVGSTLTACAPQNEPEVTQIKPVENSIEASGKVMATKIRNITLDFAAKVLNIPVREGQSVKKDETLMEMDITEYKKKIEDAEKQLKLEKLQLDKLRSGIENGNPEKNKTILNIENNLKSTIEELNLLLEQYNRKKRDMDNGTDPDILRLENKLETSNTELQRAINDHESAVEKYSNINISFDELKNLQRLLEDKKKQKIDATLALENGRNAAKNELDRLSTSITQKKAQIDNFKVDLASTKWQSGKDIDISMEKIASIESDLNNLRSKLDKPYLKENRVISELNNAIVSSIKPKAGDVSQSGTLLIELIDMDSLIVEAEVSEDFIKDLKLNAEVEVLPLADTSKSYKGVVTKISDIGKEKNGDTIFIAEITVDNEDKFLKAGFNVDVKIKK